MNNISFWADFADSKTVVFLWNAAAMVTLVIVATIVLSLVAIFLIEALEEMPRQIRGWLRRPRLWA